MIPLILILGSAAGLLLLIAFAFRCAQRRTTSDNGDSYSPWLYSSGGAEYSDSSGADCSDGSGGADCGGGGDGGGGGGD